jgi:hypothetical protein
MRLFPKVLLQSFPTPSFLALFLGKKFFASTAVVATAISLVQPVSPVLAFDSRDAMPPVLASMKLVNPEKVTGTAPIAIEVVVTDDKNWSKIDGTLNIGFSYQLKPGLNLPPNCLTVTRSFNTLEVIENMQARKQETDGATRQVFWLVGFLPAPKPLVGSCSEYRDFNLAPVIVINSSNFTSRTVRGSTIAQVIGGVYSPRISDESGRTKPQSLNTMMVESTFIPQKLDYQVSQFCLPYLTSGAFRKSGATAIKNYESEVEISSQLGVEENRPRGTAELIKGQMLQWENFESTFDYNSLKSLPLCPTSLTSASISKAYADDLKAVKDFNTLVKKDNALKFCTSLSSQLASFTEEVTIAKTEFAQTTLISSFRAINMTLFKVDCASSNNTIEKLSEKQALLDSTKKLFSENLTKAQLELTCGMIREGLPKLDMALTQAKSKFKGSLYDKLWPVLPSEDLLSFCGETTFSYESAKIKLSDFVALDLKVKALVKEADTALRKRTLKFKITCTKGKTVKKLTVTNPVCPSGYRRSG